MTLCCVTQELPTCHLYKPLRDMHSQWVYTNILQPTLHNILYTYSSTFHVNHYSSSIKLRILKIQTMEIRGSDNKQSTKGKSFKRKTNIAVMICKPLFLSLFFYLSLSPSLYFSLLPTLQGTKVPVLVYKYNEWRKKILLVFGRI